MFNQFEKSNSIYEKDANETPAAKIWTALKQYVEEVHLSLNPIVVWLCQNDSGGGIPLNPNPNELIRRAQLFIKDNLSQSLSLKDFLPI